MVVRSKSVSDGVVNAIILRINCLNVLFFTTQPVNSQMEEANERHCYQIIDLYNCGKVQFNFIVWEPGGADGESYSYWLRP